MSSLAPGNILQGAYWKYRILDPIKGDKTHLSTVFKAEVIADEDAHKTPKWAIIKVVSTSDLTAMENLGREIQAYRLPAIASTKCFRKMYDMVGNSVIALEWLETTLAEVRYESTQCIPSLVVPILEAALNSCVFLEGHQYINTDYKSANILLSGICSGSITAKVGDLGLVVPIGDFYNVQPYAMRAPEVFLGQACTGPSQVWAIAAMLLCWIKPGVLGAHDCPDYFINDSWCVAKIKQLFPSWKIPSSDELHSHVLKATVESAQRLSQNIPELQAISPFNEEMKNIDIPQQLRDLLRFMLAPNLVERPSASCVLSSREFRELKKLCLN
ncbi:hypothetical protein N7495_001421 [Penicillium taxi]|uniref:uncharacterized protein n=1 Tax=Penicillium taxi TaxID=168475 RepID=UPI0025452A81|nr:uncharacterized protein N7495_001421 [Penicillium taxi]KAJ5908739.1 hypothetical protein N7495_001421 [Penicillium taxi]